MTKNSILLIEITSQEISNIVRLIVVLLQLIHYRVYSNDIREDAFKTRAYIFARQHTELSLIHGSLD